MGRRHFPSTKSTKQFKLSPVTLDLIRQRHDMPAAQAALPEQKALSKRIRKFIRRDLYSSETRDITSYIDQNTASKVFQIPLGRSLHVKFKTADDGD